MQWNVMQILTDYGGAAGLHAALSAQGYEIQPSTVYQWSRRNSIPPNWLARVLVMHGLELDNWVMPEPAPAREFEDIF